MWTNNAGSCGNHGAFYSLLNSSTVAGNCGDDAGAQSDFSNAIVDRVCDEDISICVKCYVERCIQCGLCRVDIVQIEAIVAVTSHCGNDASAYCDLSNPMVFSVSEEDVSRFVEFYALW